MLSSRAWLRAAYACGALPFAAGVAIFLSWVATRRDQLLIAGFYAAAAGLACLAMGLLCVSRYFSRAHREATPGRVGLKAALAAALLLANVPAAVGLAAWTAHLKSLYTLTVVNSSGSALESFVIAASGTRLDDFGPLAPGESRRRGLTIPHDAELTFEARQGGHVSAGLIDGYVKCGLGADWRVTIGPGREVRVEDLRQR